MIIDIYKCDTCSTSKNGSEFYKRNGKPRTNMCKSCKSEYNKIHYIKNKDAYIEGSRKRYKNNKEQCRINSREYYYNNKDAYKARAKKRQYRLLKEDDVYKLSHNIRALIRGSFNYNNHRKNTKTSNILGCTADYFKEWLGGVPNRNTHIDHIIPSSWAESEEEVIALNHYSNFRLVDSKTNISKGNRHSSRSNIRVVVDNHNDLDTIYNILIKNKNKLIW